MSTNTGPLADRIAQAIGDPGSILPRLFDDDRYPAETVTRWATRAVLSLLGVDGDGPIPAGMDARPGVWFTVHCSHCGKPAPHVEYGDEMPSWWQLGDLPKLGDYHLQDSDWHVDIAGVDPTHGGRALVCDDCWCDGWCEICDDQIHAWQPRTKLSDIETAHQRCNDNAATRDALTEATR